MSLDVFALLQSFPALTPLVGDRVYPMVLPTAGAHPAVTWQVVSQVFDGAGFEAGGLCRLRLQIDAFAEDYTLAAAVRDAIAQALHGYQGPAGDARIQNAVQLNARDVFEDQVELYRLSADFQLLF